ncbi:hypothetical protein [Acuticoccus sediminis]|uniref:hypothetical protein n=1 Tax=Acuticoccus sediminis TaxID=2184697 RepID=UPI0013915C88|nr:hypothetical protein [Acuticoccus sediminis]
MSQTALIAGFTCGAALGVAVILGIGVVMQIRRRPKVPAFLGENFDDGDDPWTRRS